MPASRAVPSPPPTRRARLLTALAVAAVVTVLTAWRVRVVPTDVRDVGLVLFGARSVLHGVDPYAFVGPGRVYDWPWALYYPLPGFLPFLPLALLPDTVARVCFVGGSALLLAYAVTREGWSRLPLFLSASYFVAAVWGQWSPLVTAALFLPMLGWVVVCKPNLGAALVVSAPSTRRQIAPLASAAALVAISFVIQPSWFGEWRRVVGASPHLTAPVLHAGGFLVLAALLRWRRPEARLLVALACVPQSTLLYEALPLFVVPTTLAESLALTICSWAAAIGVEALGPYATFEAKTATTGALMVPLLYLPCLVMVLRRPNDGETPRWLERLVARLTVLPRRRTLAR